MDILKTDVATLRERNPSDRKESISQLNFTGETALCRAKKHKYLNSKNQVDFKKKIDLKF